MKFLRILYLFVIILTPLLNHYYYNGHLFALVRYMILKCSMLPGARAAKSELSNVLYSVNAPSIR